MTERHIGTVEHVYPKAGAVVVDLEADIKVGDKIHIQGRRDDFVEEVESLQQNGVPIYEAHRGDHVGLAVTHHVDNHADVYLVEA